MIADFEALSHFFIVAAQNVGKYAGGSSGEAAWMKTTVDERRHVTDDVGSLEQDGSSIGSGHPKMPNDNRE
jgi:hypothetical protein